MIDPEIQLQKEEDVKEILRNCSNPAFYADILKVILERGDVLGQNISVRIPSIDEYYQARLCIETETDVLDEGHLYLEIIE